LRTAGLVAAEDEAEDKKQDRHETVKDFLRHRWSGHMPTTPDNLWGKDLERPCTQQVSNVSSPASSRKERANSSQICRQTEPLQPEEVWCLEMSLVRQRHT